MGLIYLVRHGTTDWTLAGRLQGRTDIPLNSLGLEEAARLARYLAGRRIDRVFTSPLLRARQTAQVLGMAFGLTPEVHPDLQEMCFGSLEGLTRGELEAMIPGFRRRWQEDPYSLTFPGGESFAEVDDRVQSHLRELMGRGDVATVVVTHGQVIRSGVRLSLGLPGKRRHCFALSHGSLTLMEYAAGRLRLLSLNVSP